MSTQPFQVRHNPMTLTSISAFVNINGKYQQQQKDVYFIRLIGCQSQAVLQNALQQLDQQFAKYTGRALRIVKFPELPQPDQLAYYIEHWNSQENGMHYKAADDLLQITIQQRLQQLPAQYQQLYPTANPSIIKNFMVKMLFWADTFFPLLFQNWDIRRSPKFVCSGMLKKQEYFFLYFLTQLGVDVLYLNPEKDLALDPFLLKLSVLQDYHHYETVPITAPNLRSVKEPVAQIAAGNTSSEAMTAQKIQKQPTTTQDRHRPATVKQQPKQSDLPVKEKSFEELAALASSVVMIEVLDDQGECFKTGSGIIINSTGYILTNFHVVCDSHNYLIKLEGEDHTYPCQEIIKYNYIYDLALIRIERTCTPLPFYRSQKPLIRGQKVVAIGSPLGLFNSVSDGIISGFRTMQDTNMIQFTAPTSPGSSGGALLNMQGEIIGICTAGMHEGQNINLAVDCQTILPFISGFLS